MKKLILLSCIALFSFAPSFSFGQAQPIHLTNSTGVTIEYQVWATPYTNGPLQLVGNITLTAPGSHSIPPFFNIATFPTAEWVCVRGTESGASGHITTMSPNMTSNQNTWASFLGFPAIPTVPGYTFTLGNPGGLGAIDWVTHPTMNIVDFN